MRVRSASALRTMGSIFAERFVWISSVWLARERVDSSICSEADCWPLMAARAVMRAWWRWSRWGVEEDACSEGRVDSAAAISGGSTGSMRKTAIGGGVGSTRRGRFWAMVSGDEVSARASAPSVARCGAEALGVLRERSVSKGDVADAEEGTPPPNAEDAKDGPPGVVVGLVDALASAPVDSEGAEGGADFC